MIYASGDIVTIRNNLTIDDLDRVELTWADIESPLGGLKCEIERHVGNHGYYEGLDLYSVTVTSDCRWRGSSWYIPGDWFHEPCMFDGVT